ncbi:phosphoribosylformylglycinamidine synthase subunit PurL [Sneathiella sp. HT1-7]|uniref:phosphoribosylformylglycinamidine synthase subunit PurL n=1 Tax=Sneathiella sp. HT1-7 TaxID=2887192 RepID=UPI001D14EC10|nr:phosphoribosylformylglycinamidine synthase subunit PurL [Sneathiella sp. HT1-7]MCC3305985.1 phosphoribosylformylglycinamidine synthase subunit PurL [Sneathiella sp. HT1-7]
MTEITKDIVAEHGLTEDEYADVLSILGRTPNLTELGIFSVMWSEHCSYKSSKKWLKTLPTEAPWVICGPGENAGVIDIGDGQAAIFKMESHNHPSFIEPYQGAATGVGGIMRDVFTMGARPIANMNALRFGRPDHPKTGHLVSGVVAGIAGYGNCMGVPTVGGETNFHASYDGNILVNAMTVGLADTDNIFYSAAAGIGNPVVYVGSKTGRDGIHGATMASAEFDDDSEEKRPTVQVGDPFTEKLLLEACLELMATDAIVAIQDMGAAGLTSSSFEMADKGGVGIELNLDHVPMREEGMTPYEIMLSESQERMLMVLKPGREEEARKIFEKWELDFSVIGKVTDTGRMVLTMNGEIAADLPVAPLADAAPEYDRPWIKTPPPTILKGEDVPEPNDLGDVLLKLMGSSEIASRKWIWEQYDHMVMGDTIQRPGGDAAVVRVHGTKKALAITTDCTPRYCYADPEMGGAQAVAETWRNITATGGKPLAITDCMNFGNPQRPEIMGQFVGCINGMRRACTALDYPVISGNVSLYNETNGTGIYPTPAIGGVGLLADYSKMTTLAFKSEGDVVMLLGDLTGELGQTIYLREIEGREDGAPPTVDLEKERKHGDYLREMIEKGLITAAHDISDGGLGVALAEMAIAGNVGAEILLDTALPSHAALFAENQACYVITVKPDNVEMVRGFALAEDIPLHIIGTIGHTDLKIDGVLTISVSRLKNVHANWLPDLMSRPGSE